ncbi:MAG: glycoside hydrolase family 38 C-terminal domain-containing protein [Anaerolineae bacterium]
MAPILHMIGNAHIDPVWLWPWQEGFHEVKATFRSALDRMREYDDFVFCASSAAFYAWVEQSDPTMFEEIRRRVAEGRWIIVGGWWVEPDCNIPGGESFVRHGLYAQRYFREKFGVVATVGWNVDSFGHAATLPQILVKSGIRYYCFLRPGPHEKGLPGRVFWWEAADGSRVLAFRIPFEYLSHGRDFEPHIRRCAAEMKPPLDEFMCFYGVGNHGGGPTIANIECIRRLNGAADLPELRFSSPETFFRSVEQKGLPLPTVRDELQHHASGCYAAHSGIKRWNRLAENRLLAAEKWSALAAWTTGQPYPADLDRAWKNLLFNQFHDILAGTAIEPAYEDARDQIGEALAIADRGLNLAVQSFAWRIRIPQEADSRPIAVFNPHAWASKQVVELEVGKMTDEDVLLDDEGNRVPFQRIQSHATCRGRHRLLFLADLPALGYRTYRLMPAPSPVLPAQEIEEHRRDERGLTASDTVLANGRFRLEFDASTGYIASLRDLRAGVEVFAGLAAVPVVMDDPSDTWSHNVFRFDRAIGRFTASSVRLIEAGPVRWTIRVISAYGRSQLIQDFSMYADRDAIDVNAVLDWREQIKLLKLRFPVNLKFIKATSEIPYGFIERKADGTEEPIQGWIDLSGASRDAEIAYGFALLNDSKYSADVNVHDIGLTILRSPAYAHHVPAVLEPGELYSYIDQGIQRFRYTLLPHAGSWETAGVVQAAAELNGRPIALLATYHPDGTLPPADGFIAVEPTNVVVTVLKQAEDGDDLILRAVEVTGAATRATIRLSKWARVIEADFGPAEIKTFRVPRHSGQEVVETDLLEEIG